VTEALKVVGVARRAGEPFILPSADTINDGSYPIARDFYLYTSESAGPRVEQYVDWLHGSEAQAIVRSLGFVPIR
jgi:phosphate transport system substrate-binding protein